MLNRYLNNMNKYAKEPGRSNSWKERGVCTEYIGIVAKRIWIPEPEPGAGMCG
jgi:hypothetical protein